MIHKQANEPPKKPYELVLSPGARRELSETLPSAVAFAAWELISGPLLDNPRLVGSPLHAPFEGLFSARRGQYRVRYKIDENRNEIQILDIQHRRDAYRS